jgi:hypothetical protein
MIVETFPVGTLRLDLDNARLHPQENIQAIKDSLTRFGQVTPIVVREGVVVGGNGTLTAMRELDWEEVRAVVFDGTSDEAKALAIALNRTAELATWDAETLGQTLADLSSAGLEPEALGFDAATLEEMFNTFNTPEPLAESFRTTQPELKEPEPPKPKGTPVEQYALIFDDDPQRLRFFRLMKKLKEMFPDAKSNAARLDAVACEILSGEGT